MGREREGWIRTFHRDKCFRFLLCVLGPLLFLTASSFSRRMSNSKKLAADRADGTEGSHVTRSGRLQEEAEAAVRKRDSQSVQREASDVAVEVNLHRVREEVVLCVCVCVCVCVSVCLSAYVAWWMYVYIKFVGIPASLHARVRTHTRMHISMTSNRVTKTHSTLSGPASRDTRFGERHPQC